MTRRYNRAKENNILKPTATYLHENTYREYMDQFSMDAMATFEYENLPETVLVHHIEKPLFYEGHCVFTKHKLTGLPIVMSCTMYGVNIHGEPTKFRIYSINADGSEQYHQTGEIGVDGVIIKNNVFMKPTYDMLQLYCKRIADAELTIDMNVFAMRTPFIIETTKDNEQSMKLAMCMYENFEQTIFAKKNNNTLKEQDEILTVHNTGVQSHLMELMNYKHDIINDLYTRFSINNAMQDKKERMVVDEVNAKSEQISLAQSISLDYRQFAIDEINTLFGLDIQITKKGEQEDEPSEHTPDDNSTVDDKPER